MNYTYLENCSMVLSGFNNTELKPQWHYCLLEFGGNWLLAGGQEGDRQSMNLEHCKFSCNLSQQGGCDTPLPLQPHRVSEGPKDGQTQGM